MGSNGITSAAADLPSGWGRGARLTTRTPNVDRPELAAVAPAPEPTNILVENVNTGLEAHRVARNQYAALSEGLQEGLHPDLWKLVVQLVDSGAECNMIYMDIVAAELARHFPLIAPAIPHITDHIYNVGLNQHGKCCTSKGQYAAVAPVPPGVHPSEARAAKSVNPLVQLAESVSPDLMRDLSRACKEAYRRYDEFTGPVEGIESDEETNLKQSLSEEQYAAHRYLVSSAVKNVELYHEWRIAELARHLPSVAVAIQMVWAHAQDVEFELAGVCCMGDGRSDQD